MQCPQKELDTVGKQTSGADVQPVTLRDTETIGCCLSCWDGYNGHKFGISQCESHVKSELDTVSCSINKERQGN